MAGNCPLKRVSLSHDQSHNVSRAFKRRATGYVKSRLKNYFGGPPHGDTHGAIFTD